MQYDNVDVSMFQHYGKQYRSILSYIIDPSELPSELKEPKIEEEINESDFSWNEIETQPQLSYQDLPCTKESRDKVYELISTLAKTSRAALAFKKSYLEKLGEDLRKNLHPLKFLYVIFSSNDLKNYMKDIEDLIFVWGQFRDNFSRQMDGEEAKDNCTIFAIDFAKSLNIPSDKILPYFEKKNWEALLRYLIHH